MTSVNKNCRVCDFIEMQRMQQNLFLPKLDSSEKKFLKIFYQ